MLFLIMKILHKNFKHMIYSVFPSLYQHKTSLHSFLFQTLYFFSYHPSIFLLLAHAHTIQHTNIYTTWFTKVLKKGYMIKKQFRKSYLRFHEIDEVISYVNLIDQKQFYVMQWYAKQKIFNMILSCVENIICIILIQLVIIKLDIMYALQN